MSETSFQTLDELTSQFSSLKRAKKLHPLAEKRLATLLQDTYPEAYARPEPGEMPGGRPDLAFYFASGRYAVFEIFATVSQVAQDLRHLEQSSAQARIAILTDPVLDNGAIYREYYGKRPRGPFPVLNLSEILVAENETVAKQKLKEYIEQAFALQGEVPESTQRLDSRLGELSLLDEGRADFGQNRFTSGVVSLNGRNVVITAIPVNEVSCSAADVLKAAKSMLEPGKWYSAIPEDHPPRYWPRTIFRIPLSRRSHQNALFWEDTVYHTDHAHSRLVITGAAEVIFVSSQKFVTKLRDGTGVFLLGPILAECWKLSGVVAQLYHDIGHAGQTRLCIGMVGTKGTHLGGVANGYLEPFREGYWSFCVLAGLDWTSYARNLMVCEMVDVMGMEPKKQPPFVESFAEAISLAYNHETPRCFDKKTGLLPDHHFRDR